MTTADSRNGSSDDVPPRDGASKPKSIRNRWCVCRRAARCAGACCVGPCENSGRANLRTEYYRVCFLTCLLPFFMWVCVRFGGTCGIASRPPSTHSLAILHSESPLVRPQTYSLYPSPLLFSPFSSLPPASPARHAHTLPNTLLHYTTPSSLPPSPPRNPYSESPCASLTNSQRTAHSQSAHPTQYATYSKFPVLTGRQYSIVQCSRYSTIHYTTIQCCTI